MLGPPSLTTADRERGGWRETDRLTDCQTEGQRERGGREREGGREGERERERDAEIKMKEVSPERDRQIR